MLLQLSVTIVSSAGSNSSKQIGQLMAPEGVRLVTNPYSTTPFHDKNNVESSDYVSSEVRPELFVPPSAVGWHPKNGDWIDGKERADFYVERDGAALGGVKNDFSFEKGRRI